MFHKPNPNIKKPFAKYLQPNNSKINPAHTRSMVELNPHESANKENHFTSCASSSSNTNLNDTKTQKSNSISKALKNVNQSKGKSPYNNLGRMKKNNAQIYTCSISQMKGCPSGVAPEYTNRSNQNKKENISAERSHQKQKDREEDNYNLLIKLKDFIEELKVKEEKHITRIAELETENQGLKERATCLEDRIKFLELRQNEMAKKMKKQQSEKKNKSQCHQHELIIQSLKNVINQQLAKIITLEQEKLSHQNLMSVESQLSSRSRDEEVYSFKKKGFQSERLEEEVQGRIGGRGEVPEPYSHVIEGLENETENSFASSSSRSENDEILAEVGHYLSHFRRPA